MLRYIHIIFILLLIGFQSIAQVDFDNYSPVVSKGDVPQDFITRTYEKVIDNIEASRDEVGTEVDQYIFSENNNYAIDEILHSGMVTYNDAFSTYISGISDLLLKDYPEVRKKLRFYTIKSNIVNAFSTDQGIIFVTTGLISQLASEEQLAFVLSHEIVHYIENHVLESFRWTRETNLNDRLIGQMSLYSRNHEYEADSKAIDLYRRAGYSKSKLISAFDMLEYAHLPFDEREIELNYFSSELLFLPEFLFPSDEYEIKSYADKNDSFSTHPNLNSRRERLQKGIDSIGDLWRYEISKVDVNRFLEIRNMARFEYPRICLINGEYGTAIYSIYLLELEFESMYLKRLKAQSWNGLYQHSCNKSVKKTIQKTSEFEGESAKVHFLLKTAKHDGLTTLALRHVYDLYSSNSKDEEIKAIYNFLVSELAKDDQFNIDNYFDLSYREALDSSKIELVVDTLVVEEKLDKYSRIKRTKNIDLKNIVEGDYWRYGLSDLVGDETFLALLKINSRKDTEDFDPDNLRLGISKVVLVEPRVLIYSENGVDNVRSEKFEPKLAKAVEMSSNSAGVEIETIGSENYVQNGSIEYNKKMMLYSSLLQNFNNHGVTPFPIDYAKMKNFELEYETSKMMLLVVDHTFEPNIIWSLLFSAVYMTPTLPLFFSFYLPHQLMTANTTNISLLILDTNTGNIDVSFRESYNEGLSKWTVGARLYEVFHQLNSTSTSK